MDLQQTRFNEIEEKVVIRKPRQTKNDVKSKRIIKLRSVNRETNDNPSSGVETGVEGAWYEWRHPVNI